MTDDLLCLFTARVEEREGRHVVEVPDREVDLGALEPGTTYRIALVSAPSASGSRAARSADSAATDTPVNEGDEVEVEIENLGDQGDGIARVGPGYVVIVPETSPGDRVTARITEARENLAFAEVIEFHDQEVSFEG